MLRELGCCAEHALGKRGASEWFGFFSRTELDPRIADFFAVRNHDAEDHSSKSNPGIHYPERNSNRAGLELADAGNPWQLHSAIHH
jgi:hypothetical protein